MSGHFQPKSRTFLAFCLAMSALSPIAAAQAPAYQQPAHHHPSAHHHQPAPCAGTTLACANAATPLLLADGSMWLAWTAGGAVSVARSTDLGRSFGAPVILSTAGRQVDTGPDARPKIVRDASGTLLVAYSVFKDEHWNAQVLVATSADGSSFGPPRAIDPDPASQRFEALQVLPSGQVFAAWIDKRGAAAARRAGQDYAGAALAYAWAHGHGGAQHAGHFGKSAIAQENSCECCRLAIALTPSGQPAILFRNVYPGGARDHAVVTFGATGTPGPVHRVSVDDYRIAGCPHHGPSLAISTGGTYHATWFTGGTVRQGLFYARSSDAGQSFSTPMPLGAPERQAARPTVLTTADGVWLAWKEFDGEHTVVQARLSRDDGLTWSEPHAIAETADDSDHPLLVSDGKRTFLSWLTRQDGYRLIPLSPVS